MLTATHMHPHSAARNLRFVVAAGVIVFAAQPAENAQEISAAVMLLVNSRMGLFN